MRTLLVAAAIAVASPLFAQSSPELDIQDYVRRMPAEIWPREPSPKVRYFPVEVRQMSFECGPWPVHYNPATHRIRYGSVTKEQNTGAVFTDYAVVFPIAPSPYDDAVRTSMRVEFDQLRYSVFLQENFDDRESAPAIISSGPCKLLAPW